MIRLQAERFQVPRLTAMTLMFVTERKPVILKTDVKTEHLLIVMTITPARRIHVIPFRDAGTRMFRISVMTALPAQERKPVMIRKGAWTGRM